MDVWGELRRYRASMNEKREFSERLRAAMKAQKLEVSGSVLEREFNLR